MLSNCSRVLPGKVLARVAGRSFSTPPLDPSTVVVTIASGAIPMPPVFESKESEQLHRKQRLAASFRLFSKFGYDEGVAGHITARDPVDPETFWVNPFGMDFSEVPCHQHILSTVTNLLIRVLDYSESIDSCRP